MATRLEDEFDPTRINAPDAAYPAGSLKDETNPGVSDDGTPLASRVGNDWQGFSQSALDKAGIAANGQPDSVSNPQILQAIEQMYNDGDSQLAGGNIWPLSSHDSLPLGAQSTSIPINTTRLRVNVGSDVILLSLWVPSGDFGSTAQTITDISFDPVNENYVVTTNISTYQFSDGSHAKEQTQSGFGRYISDRWEDEPFLGDYGGDRTSALQRMIDENAGRRVNYHENTTIDTPIDLKSQTILRGAGNGGGQVKLIADFDASTPIPTVATGTWDPNGLSFAPMIYNSSPLQWWGLENVALDCNNSDYAYGLYLNENFYGHVDNVKISNSVRRPLTMIRTQNVGFDEVTLFNCLATSIIFDYGIIQLDNLGLEIIAARDSMIICTNQGNNKGMATIGTVWAEHNGSIKPTRSHLSMSGRNAVISNGWFTAQTGGDTYDGLWCVDDTETIAFDNINGGSPITLSPARNIDANINYQEEIGLYIGNGTSGRIRGYFNPARVVNQSGLDTVVQNFLAGQRGMSFNGSLNVYDEATPTGQPIATTDRTLTAENQVIKMIRDKLNITENGVNVDIDVKTAALTLRADAGINIVPTGGNLIARGLPVGDAGLVAGTLYEDPLDNNIVKVKQ